MTDLLHIILPFIFILIPTLFSVSFFFIHKKKPINYDINTLSWDELKYKIHELKINVNNTSENIINIKGVKLKEKLQQYNRLIILMKMRLLEISEIINSNENDNTYVDFESYNNEVEKTYKMNNYMLDYLHKVKDRDFIEYFPPVIQMIYLPLAVIVGYFGMNFKSMGVPSLHNGIYSTVSGQVFVAVLCLMSVSLYSSILYYYY